MTNCPDCGGVPTLVVIPENVFNHGYEQVGYTCDGCGIVITGIDEQDAREEWESFIETLHSGGGFSL